MGQGRRVWVGGERADMFVATKAIAVKSVAYRVAADRAATHKVVTM